MFDLDISYAEKCGRLQARVDYLEDMISALHKKVNSDGATDIKTWINLYHEMVFKDKEKD